jgi:hypothetical protein
MIAVYLLTVHCEEPWLDGAGATAGGEQAALH